MSSAPGARVSAVLATVAATAAILAATASAASPKDGYHYEVFDHAGLAITKIGMQADKGDILSIYGTDPGCMTKSGNYQGFGLAKKVKVDSNGKFVYEGKADNTVLGSGPRKVEVDIKGKFVSKKKATGSFSIQGCSGKVKFNTKWTRGG